MGVSKVRVRGRLQWRARVRIGGVLRHSLVIAARWERIPAVPHLALYPKARRLPDRLPGALR